MENWETDDLLERLAQGQIIPCPICQSPLFRVDTGAILVECANQHNIVTIVFELPGISDDREVSAIWLEAISPDNPLIFEQLKGLRAILDLSDINLVALRLQYCNGERHLLFSNLPISIAEDKLRQLRQHNIPYSVEGEHLLDM